ncbi:MAG TPA: hypothetical protein VK806_07935 [Bacteroidia bacterium]|nr:hypothetical protein [Bacteroidia bacterium]
MKFKLVLISLLSLALLSFTGGSKHKTGWEKLNLKGKVKTYRELTYNVVVNGSDVFKGDSLKYEKDYTFDANGNIIEQDENTPGGEKYKTVSVFNSKGQCIKTVQEDNYTPTNKNTYSTEYKYDLNGNKIEEDEHMNSERGYTRTIYKYDSSASQALFYFIMGSDSNKQGKLRYDNKGNLIEEDMYDLQSGKLEMKTTNTYDTLIKSTEVVDYSSEGTVEKRQVRKCDMHGNVYECTDYYPDGKVMNKWENKIEYDKLGNMVKQVVYKNNWPVEYTVFEIAFY